MTSKKFDFAIGTADGFATLGTALRAKIKSTSTKKTAKTT